MDKQEVINEIEKIDYQNLKYDSPERMLSEQKQLIIDIIDKLDELQKVKVPECVGELLDYYRKSADVDLLALLICFKDWYFRNDKTSESEEAIDWLVKHPEKFMKAWIDGYEVDEEPKWVVKRRLFYFEEFDSQMNGDKFGFNGDQRLAEAHHFSDKSKAEAVADLIGGEVKKV